MLKQLIGRIMKVNWFVVEFYKDDVNEGELKVADLEFVEGDI